MALLFLGEWVARIDLKGMGVAVLLVLLSLFFADSMHAQSASSAPNGASNAGTASDAAPVGGGNELEVWTGGGPSVAGGKPNMGIWMTGFRYGWVITGLHGPSFLRGNAEYAMDVVPIVWVSQPGKDAYGIDLIPIVLKWDFAPRHGIVPYFNLDGGLLLTTRAIPPNASHVNFTPAGAIGAHFLLHKYNVSAELRLLHASDASLTVYNPGVDTLEVRIGFGIFTHPK